MAMLDVYLKGKKVGILVDAPVGLTFAYDAEYAAEPCPEPLSHALPVREGECAGNAVESYFSNLLPDDYVRTRIGEILKIPRENTFALLEAIGGDCAGAIAFYRPGVTPMTSVDEYRQLDDEEAVRILADLEKRPLNVGDEGFRISGAGAQDKLVACVRDGHVWLPLNGTPSTHIIKPDIRNYPGSVLNEHFCMKLADACGHDVAACDLLSLRGETYYVTSRYDREVVDGKTLRLHQEDFCQVLGVDPKRKYEAQGGPGLAECQGVMSALDLSSAERVEFWGRVAFNYLVGNGDAHGKNFSVLYQGGHCTLAPMYDIMSTTVYPDVGKRMAMKVDGEYAFRWMTLGKFMRQAEKLGLRGNFIEGVLRREARKMLKAAQSLAKRLSRSHPSGIYSEITEGIRQRAAFLACSLAIALASLAFAAPQRDFHLPPVFSDHMVVQQGAIVPIWGSGPNHQWRLSCRLGDTVTWTQTYSGMKTDKGWDMKFYLPPMKAGGPYEMVFSNAVTHTTHVIHDVYVGEVWLASGQSNMAFGMQQLKNTLPEPRIEQLRIYTGSKWVVADTNSVKHLSAVATLFGRELQRELGCAVGVLSLSVGGTLAETWMSRAALKDCPTTRAWVDEYERGQSDPETWTEFPPVPKEATPDVGPAPETAAWPKPDFAADGWTTADLPGTFDDFFGRHFNGAAWFRKTVDIPAEWEGKDLVMRLPGIEQHDIVWFEGTEVGRTGSGGNWVIADQKRVYTVPGRLVKPGKRTIALRIWSFFRSSGFRPSAAPFTLGPKDAEPIGLEGAWLATVERDLGDLREFRLKRRPYGDGRTATIPSSRFNHLIAPVVSYAMKGAVWYQGESNADTMRKARDYGTTLTALIADWRHQWGLGDFPFGIVQLANFMCASPHQRNCPWAELREGQLQVSRTVKNTGLVSAIDLGERQNIHPTNKLEVARRLCRWAKAEVYGKDVGGPYTGPRYLSGALEANGKVRIRFTEAAGGIEAKGPVTGCVMCGKDGVWHPAEVAIDGETLVVSSKLVAEPYGVRYAWAQYPLGATLVGKGSGIPVFPFEWNADFP